MKSKWNLGAFFIIAWLMTYVTSYTEGSPIQSTITSLDNLAVGKNCTVRYEIAGGSGQ